MKPFPEIVSKKFDAIGTEIELQIVVSCEDQIVNAKEDLFEVKKIYESLSGIFSRFDTASELSQFNCNLHVFRQASVEFLEVAQHCLKFHGQTHGIFDPRIIATLESVGYCDDFKKGDFKLSNPSIYHDCNKSLCYDLEIKNGEMCFHSRMDFSGIAKGFITDKVSGFLKSRGWKNFLIDSGGDMFLGGSDEEGNSWRIEVDGIPHKKMMFALSEKGLATSGISKRKWEIDGLKFHHLVNPKKPKQFLFDLKTVTVISSTTEEADVWAKTLFLMGKKSAMLYARENNLAAVILDYLGKAWISPKAKEYLYI